MSVEQYSLVAHDWLNLEFIINDLASRVIGQELSPGSSPTWVGATLTGLTDNSIIFIDNNGVLSENNTNLNWDDINDILTVRETIQVKDSSGNIVMFSDDTQFYITSSVVIPIEAGMVMGLWLFWGTYASP
jgi:hypothetical protein